MKTIAWDVDDILNDLTYQWYHNEWLLENPDCTLLYEELTTNPPHNLFDVALETYLKSLDKFREDNGSKLKPNHEILDWFYKHGDKFRHLALSAVPLRYANISAEWTIRHFGSWIRSFNFVPSKRNNIFCPIYDVTKAEFLQQLGNADILIEDNEKNYNDALALGIKGFLVDKPWNSSTKSVGDVLKEITSLIEEEK